MQGMITPKDAQWKVAVRDSTTEYKARQKEILESLRTIEALLGPHYKKQQQQPWNWGYVGDLTEVSTKLKNTVKFMQGQD